MAIGKEVKLWRQDHKPPQSSQLKAKVDIRSNRSSSWNHIRNNSNADHDPYFIAAAFHSLPLCRSPLLMGISTTTYSTVTFLLSTLQIAIPVAHTFIAVAKARIWHFQIYAGVIVKFTGSKPLIQLNCSKLLAVWKINL